MLFAADGSLDPVAVLTLLGALGFIGATSVVLLVLARKAPPLTTQHNQLTGMTEHGIVTWAAWFYGLLWVLPWTVALVAEHPPLLGVAALVLAAIVYGVWRSRKSAYTPPMSERAVQERPPQHLPPPVTYASTYNPDPDATRYLTPFPTYGTPELTYPPQESPWQRPANGTPIL